MRPQPGCDAITETVRDKRPPDIHPERIGRYRILHQLGEGGFGEVYLAEQSEPVRRQVALKIIKVGMDTKQVVARFEAERQALAMMDHPNIARVLDAGATETGRPFFVMDYVRGVPITEYADTHNLPTRSRLELFLPVCQAIQHAHQKGIIHRDIKPSNILVTMHDGRPSPRVIDFGIAKAIDHRLTDKTVVTQLRQLIGTPEYMSPEQAEMSGLDIDTRSDIYSLGVVLYELLTGSTPFDSERLRSAAFGEIQRIIREQEPVRPSTRLSSLTQQKRADTPGSAEPARSSQTLDDVARRRSTDSGSLRRELRGDLDWIVMKCLEKDRTRRYETANGLMLDLERHLRSEPVLASPPSASYRVRKFIQRHRVGVVASMVVAAALVIGLGAAVAGFVRASESAEEARIERDAARAAQEKAEAINRFLTSMLESADPWKSGASVSIVDAIDRAADMVETSFAGDALLRAEILRTIGSTYLGLREHDRAERLLTRAAAIYEERLPADAIERIDSRYELARLALGRDQFDLAFQRLNDVIADRARVLGEEHEDTVEARFMLASACFNAERYAEAEEIYREILGDRRRLLGEDHPDTLKTMQGLGWLLQRTGALDEAEALFEGAYEEYLAQHGLKHAETLATLSGLAVIAYDRGDYERGRDLYRRAFDAACEVWGPEHPDSMVAMIGLANCEKNLGNVDEAHRLFVEAVRVYRERLGDRHQYTLTAINNLAGTLALMGRYEESLRLHQENLAIRRAVFGERSAITAESIGGIGSAYYRSGNYEEAAKHLREAADVYRQSVGPQHIDYIDTIYSLGRCLQHLGQWDDAEQYVRETLEFDRRVAGPTSHYVGDDLATLANVFVQTSRLGEAGDALAECLRVRSEAHGPSHWKVHDTRSMIGGLHILRGALDEAEAALLDARRGLEAAEPSRQRDRALEKSAWRMMKLAEARGDEQAAAAWRERLAQSGEADGDGDDDENDNGRGRW